MYKSDVEAADAFLEKFNILKTEISKKSFQDMENLEFGSQKIEGIQFLSMKKEKDSSGYFHCEDLYKL